MNKPRVDRSDIHYTRWVFHRRLPAYIPFARMPFVIVSITERTGPSYTRFTFMHLN